METMKRLRVGVEGGLHARPAAELVRLAKGFEAEIVIGAGAQTAPARSSLKLLLLGVKEGDEVELRTSGPDAAEALSAVSGFLSGGTAHEPAEAPASIASKATPASAEECAPAAGAGPAGALKGIGTGGGPAIGPVFHFIQPALEAPAGPTPPEARSAELEKVEGARVRLLLQIHDDAARAASPQARDILTAIASLAEDADWAAAIAAHVADGQPAITAILTSGREMAAALAALPDPYARARAEDMDAVARLLALAVNGLRPVSLADCPEGAVIVAGDLTALEIGAADLRRTGGLICRNGSATSHAAILAKAFGIPAVFGVADPQGKLTAARTVALDGTSGLVYPDPSSDIAEEFTARCAQARAEVERLSALRDVAPVTSDGTPVIVAANIGSVKDIELAKEHGAMGVGLMRTEFLFLGRTALPDEEEQFSTYRTVLEAFPGHPVVIRTLDIGGDKPVRGISVPQEENPFLGLRGIRLCLANPALFKVQLRALLRAAPYGDLKVMLPMVSDPAEIASTRGLITACEAELTAEGKAFGSFELGTMVETPAAALIAHDLAAVTAFFSIGTNDLTQYVMAADRMNPSVASLCQTDHPAVLRAIRMVAQAAQAHGIWCGICGEAASDAGLLQTFLDAGVRELSMAPASIPRIKQAIGAATLSSPPQIP
ncbi:phosphoenolpyruvate--protein phosphotransferase [Pannonibacter phragmitetus]|uniref:phosphoenolpyruvate--protein phosphotransferase n=1 Tax=Pannonibacter phragmitetus TaxID=121719 RepID=UPI0013CE65C2|nr:phosphoenolpyruvate--protein phosphotransferase [Pannonibacter phragmitetus]